MMFTARTIDGREAAEIGLAASCFEDTEFLERVDAIASMIAENSAFSIAAYKRLLAETDNVPLHLGLAHEVRNSAGVGPDMGERIAAFSKRKA
jgi:enoyl-CoA hydratase/carnithine racemase